MGAEAGVFGKGRGWGGVLAWRIDPIARRMAERVLVMEKQTDGRYGFRTGWHSFPQGEITQEWLAWTLLLAPGSSGRGTVLVLAMASIEPAGFCQIPKP